MQSSDSPNPIGQIERVCENGNWRRYTRLEQREWSREFHDELDGCSKVAGEGSLVKNVDFYESVVSFVRNEQRGEFHSQESLAN